MTDAKSPCEGIEKWDFDVVVNKPDSSATKLRDRRQAVVNAYRGKAYAGTLVYGLDGDDIISITRMETFDPFKCRGCVTQMREALQAEFPDAKIVDGGSTNSPEGDVVLSKWRERGLLHDV